MRLHKQLMTSNTAMTQKQVGMTLGAHSSTAQHASKIHFCFRRDLTCRCCYFQVILHSSTSYLGSEGENE